MNDHRESKCKENKIGLGLNLVVLHMLTRLNNKYSTTETKKHDMTAHSRDVPAYCQRTFIQEPKYTLLLKHH